MEEAEKTGADLAMLCAAIGEAGKKIEAFAVAAELLGAAIQDAVAALGRFSEAFRKTPSAPKTWMPDRGAMKRSERQSVRLDLLLRCRGLSWGR